MAIILHFLVNNSLERCAAIDSTFSIVAGFGYCWAHSFGGAIDAAAGNAPTNPIRTAAMPSRADQMQLFFGQMNYASIDQFYFECSSLIIEQRTHPTLAVFGEKNWNKIFNLFCTSIVSAKRHRCPIPLYNIYLIARLLDVAADFEHFVVASLRDKRGQVLRIESGMGEAETAVDRISAQL